MNKIKNDYGEWVTSVGSVNSRERAKVKHPKLIESLAVRFFEIPSIPVIVSDVVDMGFERWEAEVIAEAVSEYCPSCAKGGFQPTHNGSRSCESGSIASGGDNSHCSCDVCF